MSDTRIQKILRNQKRLQISNLSAVVAFAATLVGTLALVL